MKRETWGVLVRTEDSVHPLLIQGDGGRYVCEIDANRNAHPVTDALLIAGSSYLYPALEKLLAWAEAANQRLEFETDRETGLTFGGNPYLNPVLKEARAALERCHTTR